jgi:hypothetical protein
VRVRVDPLVLDPAQSAPLGKPCAGAVRIQRMLRGRLESWWEVNLSTFEEFVDLLRRANGKSAVVELVETDQSPYPPLRVWLVEEEWQREVKSSGPRTPGE